MQVSCKVTQNDYENGQKVIKGQTVIAKRLKMTTKINKTTTETKSNYKEIQRDIKLIQYPQNNVKRRSTYTYT